MNLRRDGAVFVLAIVGAVTLLSQLVEPPTADPHGGWCGGWELDTPGYPIVHLVEKA